MIGRLGSLALAVATVLAATASNSVSSAAAGDAVAGGYGDAAGYHVLAGERHGGSVSWREVAVLDPAAIAAPSWSGTVCTTADGRWIAAAILPSNAIDASLPVVRGAYAYRIDVRDRHAFAIDAPSSLGYDAPSCERRGDRVVFRSFGDAREQSTRLSVVDLASGVVRSRTVAGELTSPVPVGSTVVAARGEQIVRVGSHGRPEVLARTTGVPYALRGGPNRDLVWMTTTYSASEATAWRLSAGSLPRRLAVGPRESATLLGAGNEILSAHLTGDARLPVVRGVDPSWTLSSGGSFVSAAVTDGRRPPAARDATTGRALPTRLAATGARTFRATAGHGVRARAAAYSSQCAVPRLDDRRQVPQPDPVQVDWAMQMAARGLLTGARSRPADFANMGLPAYAANDDFPRVALAHPSGDGWDTVPRSVIEAVAAQESNWWQATFHALPGIAADPLVADYYGNGGNAVDQVDTSSPDCGYGITQVTDNMRKGQMDPGLQAKIAVDYEENIAAGLRILEQKWNQLYADGIIANDGDPRYLENWYFALWAYNTGLQPSAAFGNTSGCEPGPSCTGPDGTWGLGWLNNPNNPAYPQNRPMFLETSYDDARTPSHWPYQERVLGWMGSPLQLYGRGAVYAGPQYQGASVWLNPPAAGELCDYSVNRCSGAGLSQAGTCRLADDECWWHAPITWIDCSARCATSAYTVAAGSDEPPVHDPHPPTCSIDPADLPTTAHGAPIVVDDEPAGSSNMAGCNGDARTSQGTFTYVPGHDAAGRPIGEIDTHQLGVGFGGHILFDHSYDGSDPALINTGTWAPQLPGVQDYTIKVHLPATGAAEHRAAYDIQDGIGQEHAAVLDQDAESEAWRTLGTYRLGPGATVTLTNRVAGADGTTDLAFDALAFLPEGAQAEIPEGQPAPATPQPGPSTPDATSVQFLPHTQLTMPRGAVVDVNVGTFHDGTQPAAGVPVHFRINTGPNATKDLYATSGRAGATTFAYTDRGGAGTDQVSAEINDHGSRRVAVNTIRWFSPADCKNETGLDWVDALSCRYQRVRGLVDAVQCSKDIAETVVPVFRALKAIHDYDAINQARKRFDGAGARAAVQYVWDITHAAAKDKRAKSRLKNIWDDIDKGQHVADILETVPNTFDSVGKARALAIARDVAAIAGFGDCVQLLDDAVK